MRRKVLVYVLVVLIIGTLIGCNSTEDSSSSTFAFDKILVKEYVEQYSENNDYEVDTTITAVEGFEFVSNGFYRVAQGNTYVYYTMNNQEIATQEVNSENGYGEFSSHYRFDGLLGIRYDNMYDFYLEDGTFLGRYENNYDYLYVYDNEFYLNNIEYRFYRVEYNYEIIYNILYDTSTGMYHAVDVNDDPFFDPYEYIQDIGIAENGTVEDLFEKLYSPFFEEDDEQYYYVYSGSQILVYDNEDTLINSFSADFLYNNAFIIGDEIISQDVTMVSEDDEYSFSIDGRKYMLTTTSYNILTSDYIELELNYVFIPLSFDEKASEYKAIQITEIGPGKVMMENWRNVIVNQQGEIVSDLLNFSEQTMYYNGYFYDSSTHSLFTEDLTIISNRVLYYSFENEVFVVQTETGHSIYNVEGVELLGGEYEVLHFTQEYALLENDTGMFLYDLETEAIDEVGYTGDIIFENILVVITFDTETGLVSVLDARDYTLLTSYTIEGQDLLFYSSSQFGDQYPSENFTGQVVIYTSAATLLVKYSLNDEE